MTKADFSDEMLMRFADGELDADMSAEIERAMEVDEELVSRVALFIETRQAAQTAMKPLFDEPLPPELSAAVERMIAERTPEQDAPSARVLPFRRPAAKDLRGNRWLAPIAASLAVVVAGIGGYWLRGGDEPALDGGLHIAGISGSVLDDALAAVATGEERHLPGANQRFRAIATFRDNGQALCREFEVDSADRSTVVSVACRTGAEWRVTFAVVAPGASGGYAPASSAETLDAYLAAIDAGPPLEAAEEAEALSQLRQTPSK